MQWCQLSSHLGTHIIDFSAFQTSALIAILNSRSVSKSPGKRAPLFQESHSQAWCLYLHTYGYEEILYYFLAKLAHALGLVYTFSCFMAGIQASFYIN